MMSQSEAQHVSEEALEQYVLARLPEEELEQVEEHLLFCNVCQDSLVKTEEFLVAVKQATAELEQQPKVDPLWSRWLRSLFTIPKPVFAAAACALLALVLLVPRSPQNASVDLTAMRGPETAVEAPANARLTLRLSLEGLANPAGPFQVQVADAEGAILDRTTAEVENGVGIARLDELGVGKYWVRLYEKDELVREYALSVR